MTTTPLWVPLVVAAIGVGGVLFTQWRSDVRERNRADAEQRREEARLARDSERDRDARLFDHRRATYASVIHHYHRWASVTADVANGVASTPPEDALDEFWLTVSEVELYGGQEVAKRALTLYWLVHEWVYGNSRSKDPAWDAFDGYTEFLAASRAELGVPKRLYPKPPGEIE